jgi:hypothetical protein
VLGLFVWAEIKMTQESYSDLMFGGASTTMSDMRRMLAEEEDLVRYAFRGELRELGEDIDFDEEEVDSISMSCESPWQVRENGELPR